MLRYELLQQLFHNDNGHILSLFTVSQSSEGGDFYLANVNRIWQNIRDIRPDLAVALTEDWISESCVSKLEPTSQHKS